MRRVLVLHPFFFALYPVLAVLAASLSLLKPVQAIRPGVIILLVSAVIFVLLHRLFRDWYRAGFITSMVIIMLFYYGYSYRLPREVYLFNIAFSRHLLILGFWAIFLGILASGWLWKRIRPHVITNFLNITSGITLIYALYLLASAWLTISHDSLSSWTRTPSIPEDNIRLNTSNRPDIYYIILDGYARADILKEIYGYDNHSFINALKTRGFYIAEKSHSNYTYTQLSLASSLNFEYLDYLAFAGGVSSDWSPLGKLIINSRARTWLEEAGYKVYLSSEYLFAEIKDPAVVFYAPKRNQLNLFESLLLESTMFEIFVDLDIVDISIYTFDSHREKILNGFSETQTLVNAESPKFVFVHIIAPHAPFVFDHAGNPVQPETVFTIFDGSAFNGGIAAYQKGYIEQLTYINNLALKTIDSVMQNSTNPPIIILQADHGPAMFLDSSVETSCISERFSILNAFYLPDTDTGSLYSSITPVNTFRVIFDKYFDTNLGLLSDLNYYSSHEDPYRFINVSSYVDSPCRASLQP